MKQITLSDMQQQSEAAASAPRLRAHRNFHPELSDPIQRLAIAMEPGTYIRPTGTGILSNFAAAERPFCGAEF